MANRFWIGGTGNWSNTAHWSLTSGGSGGASAPTSTDDAFINSLTGGQTITADAVTLGRNVDFTGSTGGVFSTGASTISSIYGNLTVAANMTSGSAIGGAIVPAGTGTLVSNGFKWFCPFNITGTYGLGDDFYHVNNQMTVSGTLTTNNYAMTIDRVNFTALVAPAGATLNLGTSTIYLNHAVNGGLMWSVNSGTTVTGRANFIIQGASTADRTFSGGGKVYGSITYTQAGSTGKLILTDADTLAITFSDASNARTLVLPASKTVTITNWNVNGSPAGNMTVSSSSAGTAATLLFNNLASSDYITVQDSTASASGVIPAYAGNHSTLVSGNTNWVARSPHDFFGAW